MENNKKPSKLKTLLTIVISVAIAVFFMWLAFSGLEFHKIKGYFAEANYFWVFAAMIFGLLAYWLRAIRWNIMLEPLGYKILDQNALWTISFGYLMNLTIPRSGEVARSTALYGVEKVPVDKSFGTIILERVVDIVCMLGFLALTLVFKFNAISAFYKQSGFSINPSKILVGVGVLITGVVLFFVFKKNFENVKFIGKIVKFIDGIFNGLLSIFKLKQPVRFILLSVGIWICYYLAAYLVCFALPETKHFTFADGFFIIVVGTLGMMVPASGGIGAFHFALKLGIGALFFSEGKTFEEGAEIGLAYAFISHTMQLVIMAIMGFISIPMLAKARNKVVKNNFYQ